MYYDSSLPLGSISGTVVYKYEDKSEIDQNEYQLIHVYTILYLHLLSMIPE